MAAKSCRVTLRDSDGIAHTAEVTAETLFEAVALGLAALRRHEWIEGIHHSSGLVKVSVADVRVEHEVMLKDFLSWLESLGKFPREIVRRQKVRAILGTPV
ncbi:MAG TPA: hypothetical protein VFO34_17025 [Candidatus Acidoferrales bacterium]|nr:hypothetical protein [Candidatus Acidoferrales bacterium]